MMPVKILASVALCVALAPSAVAQAPIPAPPQSLLSEIGQYINLPIVYEFKPVAIGILARVQVGRIRELAADIDSLAGVAMPTKRFTIGGSSLSDLTGQLGTGLSWSWTKPGTNISLRLGVGVLMLAGQQPIGSIYAMVGVR